MFSALANPDRPQLMDVDWSVAGATFPKNNFVRPITVHHGNGSDPLANSAQGQGQHVRFTSWAPRLELQVTYGDVQGGFRLKVYNAAPP